MARMKLSPGWDIFYRELVALFQGDPEVHVIFNEEEYDIKLFVDNPDKADALAHLLPEEKEFGNVTLKIEVVPANLPETSAECIFRRAFSGNTALSYIKTVSGIFANDITYVVFKNHVVQYFNDDLGDVNGQCSTLFQNIAKEVFNPIPGVYYCTDVPSSIGTGSLGKPLGEWP